MTGVTENEQTILYPSNRFRLTLSNVVNEVKYTRTLIYVLRPRKAGPVELVSVEAKEYND